MMRRACRLLAAGAVNTGAPKVYEGMPRYPQPNVTGTLRAIDYTGTASFAVSGAITAAMCGLNLYGCTVVGVITALGGGTVRDILFGKCPAFWFEETEYMYISVLFAVGTFMYCYLYGVPSNEMFEDIVYWTDTVGLGGFCVIGTMFGCRLGYPWFLVLVGTVITCTGGGIIRDVLCRRPVRVLHSHAEAYAETTLAGGAVYLAARAARFPLQIRVCCGVATVVALRIWATKFDLRLPSLVAPPSP